jgi:adenine-specific DNA-methyltransferase
VCLGNRFLLRPAGADVVFVNADSLIPQARSLDGVFKARMFAGVKS